METTNILLRLPKELKADIENLAKEKGISTVGLIRLILNDFIESRHKGQTK